jgi:hypothetical protein
MAIYNTTNVKNLPQLEQITNNDYLIVETNVGTNIILFKDFVVGPGNVSFYNVFAALCSYTYSLCSFVNTSLTGMSASITIAITGLSASVDSSILSLSTTVSGELSRAYTVLNTAITGISSYVTTSITAFSAYIDTTFYNLSTEMVEAYPRVFYVPFDFTVNANTRSSFAYFNSDIDDIDAVDVIVNATNVYAATAGYIVGLSSNVYPGFPQPYTYMLTISAGYLPTSTARYAVKVLKYY